MNCSLHSVELPKPKPVRVNGVEIPRSEILRETQNFPAKNPVEAWKQAARALVIRELLLTEIKRLDLQAHPKSENDRTETVEEASIRDLFEREVTTPEPNEETCRNYYGQNPSRFLSATIYEAAHILFAADRRDLAAFDAAIAKAHAVAQELRASPGKFELLASIHSDCPSAEQGGNLGQLTSGQTTPAFEKALLDLLPGKISNPVQCRYGVHLIRLDRKIEGKQIPFEAVKEGIAEYLRDSVQRRASAQYIARLVSGASIEGIDLSGIEEHRVN